MVLEERYFLGRTYAELTNTPIGKVSFVAGDRGLQQIAFAALKNLKESSEGDEKHPSLKGLQTLSDLIQEMNAYFFGLRKTFSIDLDWGVLKGFQLRVLQRTAEIPYGQVLTYGQLGRELGQPGAARAVGQALGANPMPIVIPCHRVIGSDGKLHGYAGGLAKKAFLLNLEGHRIEKDRLVQTLG